MRVKRIEALFFMGIRAEAAEVSIEKAHRILFPENVRHGRKRAVKDKRIFTIPFIKCAETFKLF